MQNQISVDPRDLENLKCEMCNSEFFKEVTLFKKVSPLISGNPKTQLIPVPVFVCNSCGHINKEFQEFLGRKADE